MRLQMLAQEKCDSRFYRLSVILYAEYMECMYALIQLDGIFYISNMYI